MSGLHLPRTVQWPDSEPATENSHDAMVVGTRAANRQYPPSDEVLMLQKILAPATQGCRFTARRLVEELLRGRSVDVMFVRGAERTHTEGILFTFLNFNGESGLGSLLGGVEHDVELGA